ncbi:hypothetical protein [Haemophilus influenzae]|uniref:hypothetical protein n=1 Tax=Haemophilus influenzae TaxID=727 RepID=UPI0021596077|nr:hypothetical protein [Haemophilus influenzae]
MENNKFHFEKLGNENLAKSRRIKELESDNDRLRIKVEQIRQDNLKLLENRPHFSQEIRAVDCYTSNSTNRLKRK